MTTHKMGTDLTRKIRLTLPHHHNVTFLKEIWRQDYRPPTQQPFRVVQILRNFYSALVSGYLYHQRGSECEKDARRSDGQPRTLVALGGGFENAVRASTLYPNITWPPAHGRNLCEYLAEESERDGMRVYMEWIHQRDYGQLVAIDQLYRQHEDRGQVLRLCLEDFQLHTQVSLVRQIHHFLFPFETAIVEDFQLSLPGDHGTHAQEEEKERLLRLVAELDREFFHGRIAQESNHFGCGGMIG